MIYRRVRLQNAVFGNLSLAHSMVNPLAGIALTLESRLARVMRSSISMKSAIFAFFASSFRAESVVNELRLAGFPNSDVSVLFPDTVTTHDFARIKPGKIPENAVLGASTGGFLGGLAGWLVSLGALTIPGAGPLIAAGPIFAAFSGAAVGATAGGLSGAFISIGFAEYQAQLYTRKLEAGNILIAAHTQTNERAKIAREIFERADAQDIGVTQEPVFRN